jgi:hypothetical protein
VSGYCGANCETAVKGAEITVYQGTVVKHGVTSGVFGQYVITGLQVGGATVKASATGYMTQFKGVTLVSGRNGVGFVLYP